MEEKYYSLLKTLIGEDAVVVSSLFGGMMNEAYIVRNNKNQYVFYIPTAQANEMVNRKLEREIQDHCYEIGVTRKCTYFDIKTGVKLLEFIEGNSIDKIEKFDYEKVADLLYKFHSKGEKSSVNYNPLKRLNEYRIEASNFVEKFDSNFEKMYRFLMENKQFLESQNLCLAHNDAQKSNIILGSNGEYSLIDFEFAANNDPLYDVATFGNQSVDEGLKLLDLYNKKANFAHARRRYLLWRIDISLQWHLVAIIKHYRGEGKTHGYDFLSVANHFLSNALDAYSKALEN